MALRVPEGPRASVSQRLFRAYLGDHGLILALLVPSIVILLAVVILPLLYALDLSLKNSAVTVVGGVGTVSGSWIWLQNYIAIFSNPQFWSAFRHTMYYFVVSIVIELVFGTGIALLLNQRFRGKSLVRTLVFVPWAIPTVVNANLWGMILNGNAYGALNALMGQLGLLAQSVVWLNTTPVWEHVPLLGPLLNWAGGSLGMNAIIVGDEWKTLPIVAFLVLSGLQAIPTDFYEAARLDGASLWAQFRAITLPLLGPILAVVLILRTMQLLRAFTIMYTLEGTGLPVLSILAYQYSFSFGYFGQGAAVAMVIGLLALLVTFVYLKLLYREELQ